MKLNIYGKMIILNKGAKFYHVTTFYRAILDSQR